MPLPFEARRKLVHIVEGTAAAVLVRTDSFPRTLALLLVLTLTAVSLIAREYDLPIAAQLHRTFGREEHGSVMPAQGSIFLLLGIIAAVSFFPPSIALAGIIVVTLGDSTNAIVGTYIDGTPSPLHPERNIEGFLAAVAVSVAACLVILPLHIALPAVLAGMLVENSCARRKQFYLDDNMLIPIAVGLNAAIEQHILLMVM